MKRIIVAVAVLFMSALSLPAAADTTRVPTIGTAGAGIIAGDQFWSGANDFYDGLGFTLNNIADPTKRVRFSAGSITTGNIRTFTFPDADGTLHSSGSASLFPDGTAGVPSGAFTSDADGSGTGFYRSAVDAFAISAAGTGRISVDATYLRLRSTHILGWSSAADVTSVPDLFQSREAAATLQLGVDVNGAAVAQVIKAHDGITGTDVAGGDLRTKPGRGTGAGAGGNYGVQTATVLGTGTTQQSYTDRELVVAKAKALTAAAATSFVQCAIASGTVFGGVVEYTIEANDGIDFQSRSGILPFSAVNKAGTETCTVGTVAASTEVVAVSAGTLTNTFTCSTSPTNAVDIQANAASSLVETTLRITYAVRLHGGTGVCTAQ